MSTFCINKEYEFCALNSFKVLAINFSPTEITEALEEDINFVGISTGYVVEDSYPCPH